MASAERIAAVEARRVRAAEEYPEDSIERALMMLPDSAVKPVLWQLVGLIAALQFQIHALTGRVDL